ncbi:MAG: prepilin-type cleavage/methylation domain-containing protein [Candidatus Parabeggiatoa sp. nov. 3]|nr:MAG: prepilin-type cleavage/methylation domain-containing protein [Gammaproteobacteria bacterium]RKZ62602.1 MAG: prepilin-type cleavage/methylation domain-containing protein [Gammaproteobacteria bacterium]RKZ83321.1 MAG: prepilin-type cleavage/methylation domain-containing protein [Gammaproteobacteria bacterium]
MKKRQGFTLVEMSIVIVIVGLLLGMVLKGKEMITNAKIQNIENSFNSLAQAVSIYQERYHALPGDDQWADLKFGDNEDISITNGNGDGVIEGHFDSESKNDEARLVWSHLRYANLVLRVNADNQQEQPANPYFGIIGISSNSLDNGAQGKNMPLFVGLTQIPGHIAIILESHSDDLIANKGRIRSNQNDYDEDNRTSQVKHKLYFSL